MGEQWFDVAHHPSNHPELVVPRRGFGLARDDPEQAKRVERVEGLTTILSKAKGRVEGSRDDEAVPVPNVPSAGNGV